jgi:hypothetical protein
VQLVTQPTKPETLSLDLLAVWNAAASKLMYHITFTWRYHGLPTFYLLDTFFRTNIDIKTVRIAQRGFTHAFPLFRMAKDYITTDIQNTWRQ